MNSKNYDEIRNMTILFFLDRLVDKGQSRTLHDLSCQFGTKGFTKEMRQIAGGSQAGLKKFLSQYPSLFTIDGEYVSITCYNNNNGNGSLSEGCQSGGRSSGASGLGVRDYAQEAVDYFEDKLDQYGPAEVPIKSLLGHRSQATPEVRHISGQHIREFKDFLLKYPEVFVVREEYVVLKKHWDTVSEGGINAGGVLERREMSPTISEPPPVDPRLTAQILDICRMFVDNQGPTSVDHLFGQLSVRLAKETQSRLLKNAQDLSVFLKMHSDSFLVQGGVVSLVPLKPNSSSTSSTAVVASRANSTVIGVPGQVANGFDGSGNKALDTLNSATVSPISAPLSPSMKTNSTLPPALQTFKQRLMTHVIKAVADNNAMEQRIYQSQNAPAAGNPVYANIVQGIDIAQTNARLLKVTKVITKIKDCQAIVARLETLPEAVISLDAEGVNLGPSGPMTLLQIGTPDGQVFIFDLVTCKDLLVEGGLKDVLVSPNITKVVHDCRNDSAALFHQFGIALENVFDTQAAHAVLQLQQTGKPVHKVKNISLNNLCRTYGGPINPKKEQMKKLYRRDQKFWSRRPLTEDMILYAAYDVWALVPTVYDALKMQLDLEKYGALFSQLCTEQVDTYVKVEKVKLSKKQRKVETEVAELKRKLATVSSKAIVLSNREIRLLRHVDLTNEEREKLEGSYKVARKLERLQGRTNASSSGNRSNADSSEASPDFDDDDYDEEEEEEDEDDDEEDDELDGDEEELDFRNSDDGRSLSPFCSRDGQASPTFEESIRMMQKIIASERFEGLGLGFEECRGSGGTCPCSCHLLPRDDPESETKTAHGIHVEEEELQREVVESTSKTEGSDSVKEESVKMVDIGCQTLSTGDIVITKVYFDDKGDSPKAGVSQGNGKGVKKC